MPIPETKKYYVAVSRPVIQSVIIEVEAEDNEDAAQKAMDKAEDLPDDAWSGEFEPENYGYDVAGLLSEEDVEPEEKPDLQRRIREIKYVLLRGDIQSGEGAMLFQPWLFGHSSLFIADVSGDWLQDLQLLADEGVDGVIEWLEELAVDATKIPPEVTARLPWLWQQRNKDNGES